MKITINNTELEFYYGFEELEKLCEVTGKELTELETITTKLSNIPLIASIGTGKTEEEIRVLLRAGKFEAVKTIVGAFGESVTQYFSPNSQSQTN